MNRYRKATAALLLCAASALSGACDSPNEPSNQTLQLTGEISRNIVPSTGTATLTFRLQNTSDASVTVRFTSGCQILPYIATRTANFVVYPSGGSWACTAIISEMTIRAGAAITEEVVVFAANPLALAPPGTVPLAAGEYSAYARVEATTITMQSVSVPFIVQ